MGMGPRSDTYFKNLFRKKDKEIVPQKLEEFRKVEQELEEATKAEIKEEQELRELLIRLFQLKNDLDQRHTTFLSEEQVSEIDSLTDKVEKHETNLRRLGIEIADNAKKARKLIRRYVKR